jgi:hypothetical protein
VDFGRAQRCGWRSYADRNRDGYGYADKHPDRNRDRDLNADSDSHANEYAHSDSYSDSHQYAYVNAFSHTYGHASSVPTTRRTGIMQSAFRSITLLLLLLLPAAAGANDYTITIPAGNADARFQALCAQLHDELGNPPAWTLEKCARRFLRIGAKAYYRERTADQAMADMGASITAAQEAFDADFPDQWWTQTPPAMVMKCAREFF